MAEWPHLRVKSTGGAAKHAKIQVLKHALLALTAIAASCLAQDADRGFHISGTVTDTQTGQPIKQALVNLRLLQQNPAQFPALTDSAGGFLLTGLGPGTYRLDVEKKGYVPDPGMVRENVVLGPSRDAVALRLQPLGKIAGRVTDSRGDPVPGVAVRALRSVLQEGRRSFDQAGSADTDDRGQYCLWDLGPGDYYILAAGRSGSTVASVGTLASGSVHEAFAPVYYPAAGDRASATPITLAPGQEFTADVKIVMQPAFRVRGSLRNVSAREPVTVELLREAGETGANRVLVNSTTGRFEVNDVLPGTYLLRASQGENETEVRGEQRVQIDRVDLDGLVVELLPGVKVTGAVHGAPTVKMKQRSYAARCDVILQPAGKDAAGNASLEGNSDEDGNFTINGVHAGRYRVQVSASGAYVASLVSGRQDLANGGELVILPGTPPEPLEIVLRTDGGTIAGNIADSAAVIDDAEVVLARAAGGKAEVTTVDQGKFQFEGLAPGEYQVYLFEDADSIEYQNPEVLRRLKGGKSIQVTAGGTTTVTLKAVAQ